MPKEFQPNIFSFYQQFYIRFLNSYQSGPIQKMQTSLKPSLASSTPRLPARSLEEVFDASRTLQSITVAKNEFESSENILEVPITYDLNGLKVRKSDANKLLLAVRNFHRDGERLEQYREELAQRLEWSHQRRLEQKKASADKSVSTGHHQDVTQKVTYLKQSRSSDRLSYSTRCQQTTQKRNLNRLLDTRLAELKKDFARMDKAEGLQSARRIPKKLSQTQKGRQGQRSTMKKLNRDIRAIIEQPLVTQPSQSGAKEGKWTESPGRSAEVSEIVAPLGKGPANGMRGLGQGAIDKTPAERGLAPVSPVISLQIPRAGHPTGGQDGVSPAEQSIQAIDKDIGQEAIQDMVLSQQIAGMRPRSPLRPTQQRPSSDVTRPARSAGGSMRGRAVGGGHRVPSGPHNFRRTNTASRWQGLGRANRASTPTGKLIRPTSQVSFAQTQRLPMTIVSSSASGHLLGVKSHRGAGGPSNNFTQNLLQQLLARLRLLTVQAGQSSPRASPLKQASSLLDDEGELGEGSLFLVSGCPKRIIEKPQTPASGAKARMWERERMRQAWSDFPELKEAFLQPMPRSSPPRSSQTSRRASPKPKGRLTSSKATQQPSALAKALSAVDLHAGAVASPAGPTMFARTMPQPPALTSNTVSASGTRLGKKNQAEAQREAMLAVSERSSPSLTLAANSRAATASHTQTRRKVALTTKDPTAGGQIQPVAEADNPATKASYVLKKVSVGIDDRTVTEAAAEEKEEQHQDDAIAWRLVSNPDSASPDRRKPALKKVGVPYPGQTQASYRVRN